MSSPVHLEELIVGVDESIVGAHIALAKFDFMHHAINRGAFVDDLACSLILKHFLSDLYSALDRMMIVLHASCHVNVSDDLRSVSFWYSHKLFKPESESSGNAGDLSQSNEAAATRAVDNILGPTTSNDAKDILKEELLQLQCFRIKKPDGAVVGYSPFGDEATPNEPGPQRSMAYLHYLRNIVTHRYRVVPASVDGFLWINLRTQERTIKTYPSQDADVQCVRIAKGMWIEIPIDPRQNGQLERLPLMIILSHMFNVVKSLRHNIMVRVLRVTQPHFQTPQLPEVSWGMSGRSGRDVICVGNEEHNVHLGV